MESRKDKNDVRAKVDTPKKSGVEKFVNIVETVGNKLPHPFWLFTFLMITVVILSKILSSMGLSVTSSAMVNGVLQPVEVSVKNLMTWKTWNEYMGSLQQIYVNYAPLGQLILMIMSVGFAEKTGFFDSLMRKTLIGTPESLIILMIAFVGVNSSIGFGAGVVFTMVIAAAMFKAMGIHPWVGIIAGYAAANGGFTANFLPTAVDTMLSAITMEVIATNGIDAPGHPLVNYYYIFAATIVLILATTFVTQKFLMPYIDKNATRLDNNEENLEKHKVTAEEVRGLKFAGVATIAFFAILLIASLPETSFLRNAEGAFLPSSPILDQIITLLFFLFFAIGISYGIGAKVINKLSDIPNIMQDSLGLATTFMVVALPAAFFVKLFSESQIATLLAVNGATWLKATNISGMPLFIMITLLSMFINLFITSNSGKWIMLAPFLVPMMAMLNVSPAMTQVLYRIGDSTCNIISPVELNVPIALGLLETYRVGKNDKVGIGTLISMSLPYTIVFAVALLALVFIFYVFNLPLGPGASIFIN